MYEYKHYAKAAYSSDNIKHKIDIGTDGIEIQLIDVNTDLFWRDDWLDIIPLSLLYQIKIIHMPLSYFEYKEELIANDFGIETKMGSLYLEKLCKKVAILHNITNHKIGVVCHIETADTILKRSMAWIENTTKCRIAWDLHIEQMRALAEQYPFIDFYVENSLTLTAPLTAYKFVKTVDLPNVKLCVDVCHLLMCQDAASRLQNIDYPYYSLGKFFKKVHKYVGLIHFCGATNEGYGYGYENGHGTVTKKKLARKIYTLLRKYDINVPLTLEVREDNYLNCKNYRKQLKLCRKIEKNLT